jgi:hypothetical protein
MFSVSVYVSSSFVMAWWLPGQRVKTSFNINKTIYKWVGWDGEYLFTDIEISRPVNGKKFIC